METMIGLESSPQVLQAKEGKGCSFKKSVISVLPVMRDEMQFSQPMPV